MQKRALVVLVSSCSLLVASLAGAASTQNVTLRTEDGVSLGATLYLPQRPGPGVILLHMQTRTREDWRDLGGRLAEAGFAALAIDFRGHGSSAPLPADAKLDSSQLQQDVKAARAFLASRADVVQGRVGIVGASIGANVGLIFAAGDPSVKSVALLSVGLDYRGLRTESALERYGKRAALLVASEEDSYATNSARRLAGREGGIRELRLLSGAGHGTTMLSRQTDLAGALVDWFRRTLL